MVSMHAWDEAGVICGSLTFLIVVTVLFELGTEKLREAVRNEPMEHIVKTLFSELTVLGFIGLIAFAVTKSGVLKDLSTVVYNCHDEPDEPGRRESERTECEGKIGEVFETLHMMLFLTMCLFLCQVLVFVFFGHKNQQRWALAEHAARTRHKDNPDATIAEYDYAAVRKKHTDANGVLHKPNHWNPLAYSDWCEWWEARYKFGYARMRQNFIQALQSKKPFPQSFAYCNYLSERMGHEVAEIVEVPVRTWLALQALLCAFLFVLVAIDNDKQKLIWIWLSIDWGLLFLYIYIWMHLKWVRLMLGGHGKMSTLNLVASEATYTNLLNTKTSPKPQRKERDDDNTTSLRGKNHNTKTSPKPQRANAEPEELGSPLMAGDTASSIGFFSRNRDRSLSGRDESIFGVDGEYRALYLDPALNDNKSKRTCFQKMFPEGETIPNLHENLFWGQKCGKSVMRQLIRWILLNNAIYLAFFFYFFIPFVLKDSSYQWYTTVLFFTASMIPPVTTIFVMTPMTLRTYVHVTAIEMMKDDQECCRDRAIVLSKQKTRKTITMLKMIETMESSCRMTKMQENLSEEEKAEKLKKLSIRERDEMEELFQVIDEDNSGYMELPELSKFLHSLHMEEIDVSVVMKEIDTSGDGKISLSEFMVWMALKAESSDSMTKQERIEEKHRTVKRIYMMFDLDGSKSVGPSELQSTLAKFGFEMTSEEVQQMVMNFDEDGDGFVNLEEFEDLMIQALDTTIETD